MSFRFYYVFVFDCLTLIFILTCQWANSEMSCVSSNYVYDDDCNTVVYTYSLFSILLMFSIALFSLLYVICLIQLA